MTFFLQPAPGKVIVREDSFKYEGLIKIPEKIQRRPTMGRIEAVGEGVEDYKVGEKLVFGLYSGVVINFKNQPAFRVLNTDEILCKYISEEEMELEGVGV
jgi:co-chaperonin GroES (HSP10)